MNVLKRDGSIKPYEADKVILAVTKAMMECEYALKQAEEIAEEIEEEVVDLFDEDGEPIDIEVIQDFIEEQLMEKGYGKVAKAYILYRAEQAKKRENKQQQKEEGQLLTDEFISKYKHLPNPFPNPFAEIVFYRTYSRFLPEEGRREKWYETCRRAVEYNCSLAPTKQHEAEELFDNMYHLRQFLSGRTIFAGGTLVSKKFPLSNFNCCFSVVDSIKTFPEAAYLLLLGCGYGFRILKEDVEKIPPFKNNVELIHQHYVPVPKGSRKEYSSLEFHGDTIAIITVGDSKVGWVKAIEFYFEVITTKLYTNIDTIVINYDNVRPFGEKLKTFGGSASGHSAILTILEKIHNVVLKRGKEKETKWFNIEPIDCLDFQTSIAEGIVVGGTRRSASIGLGSMDDEEFVNAKQNLYTTDGNGNWIINQEIINRQLSNNTILFYGKPTREELHEVIRNIMKSSEPGLCNAEEALRRNPYFKGLNPCGEILLDSEEVCNLVTQNMMAFVWNGILQKSYLFNAFRLATRASMRMTCVDLELPNWDKKLKRDRLIGVSLTGWQDMVNALKMSVEEQKELLKKLRFIVHDEAKCYAEELEINEPLLKTCVKPEGTLSQLPTVSSGVHFSHSPYYLRRVRMNAIEPLVEVCKELGYKIYNEVGQTEENCKTKVVEFPIKAPEGRTKYDVSAIEQLEIYKMFMEDFTDFNTSITVHVRGNEWDAVEEWVWENWDCMVGISFIPLDDSFYELLPYESISKEKYEALVENMKPFNSSLIEKYEKVEIETEVMDDGCASGACPVR